MIREGQKAIDLSVKIRYDIQVEQPRDLARDSGQRKLTYSLQNHCASSRSVYLIRQIILGLLICRNKLACLILLTERK